MSTRFEFEMGDKSPEAHPELSSELNEVLQVGLSIAKAPGMVNKFADAYPYMQTYLDKSLQFDAPMPRKTFSHPEDILLDSHPFSFGFCAYDSPATGN